MENKNDKPNQKTKSSMDICIDNCTNTYKLCVSMVNYCVEKGGDYASPRRIQLLQDCARVCGIAANFMIRKSEFHSLTCATCAKISLACADSCEAFPDDEMMKSCAEACRASAKSCEEMCVMK